MKKKYAFLLMGEGFNPAVHTAVFETSDMESAIYTVRNLQEAISRAKACAQSGVGAIELCGAFGEEGAQKITEVTGGAVAVGYVVHSPAQATLFSAFFGE